jgi:hypothetical protein
VIETPFSADGATPTPATVEHIVESWLYESLQALALPLDFAGKVLASARDASACISEETSNIRLQVFIPTFQPAHGQTWGFFRTIRNEENSAGLSGSTRVISFYLYVEGSTRRD